MLRLFSTPLNTTFKSSLRFHRFVQPTSIADWKALESISPFPEYQIFLTTYDKPWYQYAKSHLEGNSNWVTMEFYARRNHHGYETPLILPDPDLISEAEDHHAECDYKAAAVYARSAFEQMIRDYCDKRPKKAIPFHKKAKDYKSQHFWSAIRDDPKVAPLVADVERYRELVLNPFSHYDTEKHEIGTELRDAINTTKALKAALRG